VSGRDEPRKKDEAQSPKRVLLSKGRDEAWEAFKARVVGAVRDAGILKDQDPKGVEDRDRRPE
jgi:hypothetical protein